MGPFSDVRAERAAQVQLVVGFVLLFLAVLVVGLTDLGGRDWSQMTTRQEARDQGPLQLEVLRSVFGGLFALWACRMVWLVRRHREEVRTVRGLRGRYVGIPLVQVPFALWPGWIGMWWPGVAGAAILLVAAVLAWRITPIPAADMAHTVDQTPPRTWQEPVAQQQGCLRYGLKIVGWSLLLLVMIIGLAYVFAKATGNL